MPIYKHGYEHFEGKKRGRIFRILVITWEGLKLAWPRSKKGWFFWMGLILMNGIPLFLFGVLFFLFAYFQNPGWMETARQWIQPFLGKQVVELYFKEPGALRPFIWSYLFALLQNFIQFFFAILVISAMGPPLISSDLKYDGIQLYFSRPIQIWEYLLGKFLVVFIFVLGVCFLPILFLFLLSLVFSPQVGAVFWQTFPVLLKALLVTILFALPAGFLILYLSSLFKNHRFTGFLWLGIWIISSAAPQFVGTKEKEIFRVKNYSAEIFDHQKNRLDSKIEDRILKELGLKSIQSLQIFEVVKNRVYLIETRDGAFYFLKNLENLFRLVDDQKKENFFHPRFQDVVMLYDGKLSKRMMRFIEFEFMDEGIHGEIQVKMLKEGEEWEVTLNNGRKRIHIYRTPPNLVLYQSSTYPTLISLWSNLSALSNQIYGLSHYLKKDFLSPQIKITLVENFFYTHPWYLSLGVYILWILIPLALLIIGLKKRL
ncbi:MAG: hypothetical protein D6785_09565 [Planctomycetota bacterium]|nr:MAG: hypothetical protein D6785_09565 [Planctomycetota bacterium]